MIHHRLGLLGHQLSYSRSAQIHLTSARICQINNPSYQLIDLAPSQLHSLPTILKRHQITGFNITTPYKQVATLQHILPLHSTSWWAVNTATLNSTSGLWEVTNTDGIGFAASLQACSIDIHKIRHLIVLGFGGASHGVLQSLFASECQDNYHPSSPTLQLTTSPTITILWRRIKDNHTTSHSHPFIQHLLDSTNQLSASNFRLRAFNKHEMIQALNKARQQQQPSSVLLLQATPNPHQGDPLTEWALAIQQAGLIPYLGGCMDMCYHPSSAFQALCRQAHLPYASGWHMLLEQARAAQHIWWQTIPDLAQLEAQLPPPSTY